MATLPRVNIGESVAEQSAKWAVCVHRYNTHAAGQYVYGTLNLVSLQMLQRHVVGMVVGPAQTSGNLFIDFVYDSRIKNKKRRL